MRRPVVRRSCWRPSTSAFTLTRWRTLQPCTPTSPHASGAFQRLKVRTLECGDAHGLVVAASHSCYVGLERTAVFGVLGVQGPTCRRRSTTWLVATTPSTMVTWYAAAWLGCTSTPFPLSFFRFLKERVVVRLPPVQRGLLGRHILLAVSARGHPQRQGRHGLPPLHPGARCVCAPKSVRAQRHRAHANHATARALRF